MNCSSPWLHVLDDRRAFILLYVDIVNSLSDTGTGIIYLIQLLNIQTHFIIPFFCFVWTEIRMKCNERWANIWSNGAQREDYLLMSSLFWLFELKTCCSGRRDAYIVYWRRRLTRKDDAFAIDGDFRLLLFNVSSRCFCRCFMVNYYGAATSTVYIQNTKIEALF